MWFHEKVIFSIASCINQPYCPNKQSPRKYMIFRDSYKSLGMHLKFELNIYTPSANSDHSD